MLLVRTYVAASRIEGLGVFADEFIPAGTLLWQLHPKFALTLSVAEVEAMPLHAREYIYKYSFPHLGLGEGYLVLEMDNGKYMNHSYSPNTDFTQFDRGVAIRDIRPGEEITCNYHEFDPTFAGEFLPYAPNKEANGLHVSHS